jgi:outer membrane biosynthesis protein TonB
VALAGADRLARAAFEAVRRWVFEPAELWGTPVGVYYTLTVNFKVDDKPAQRSPGKPITR